MNTITIKQNDNGIGIKGNLLNENGYVDLTGSTVYFLFDDHQIPAQVTDPSKGEILVVFERIHTEKVGTFECEVEVVFSDGRNETFPNDSYIELHIMQDKGGM